MLHFADKEKDSEKQKNTKDGIGSVHNQPHYTKLYETLKGAYSNYMVLLFGYLKSLFSTVKQYM